MLGLIGDVNQLSVPSRAADTVGSIAYPAVAAHRGGADLWPQNTIVAFREAATAGPHMVLEMDVMALKDGALVLSHDAFIDKVSADGQTGAVKDMTSAQWATLRIKHPKGGSSAPAAFLSDVLTEYGCSSRTLMIELKDPTARNQFVKVLWPYREQVIACSFDANSVRILAGSGFHTQLLSGPAPASIPDGLNSIGVQAEQITPALVAKARAKDTRVWAWGVTLRNNDPALLAMGVDGFIVNSPTI